MAQRFALLLVLSVLLAGGLAAEPIVPRLGLKSGDRFAYRESLEGGGTLTRHTAEGERELPLKFRASSRREFLVAEGAGDRFLVTARCTATDATLTLADQSYREQRPWRGFELVATPAGAVLDAVVLPPDEDPEPTEPMPLDLDLGELLVMMALGWLPPESLKPGETWAAPADDQAPFRVRGRLADGRGPAGEAVWSTRLEATIPERGGPAPEVRSGGTLTGDFEVRFGLDPGRVIEAGGPVDLRLRFRRPESDTELAAVALHLTVRVVLDTGRRADGGA